MGILNAEPNRLLIGITLTFSFSTLLQHLGFYTPPFRWSLEEVASGNSEKLCES
jgi:hypothetical protein